MRSLLALITFLTLASPLGGCAQVLGKLRADLNDEPAYGPTTGGIYPDSGYLDEEESDRYIVGHGDRSPASERSSRERRKTWITPDDEEVQQRNRLRKSTFASEDEESPSEEQQQPERRTAPRRMTREDFTDNDAESGSLWAASGQTNFFFSKNRARTKGDIITITVENEMLRDVASEVKRTLTADERDREMDLLKPAELADGKKDSLTTSSASPERAQDFASLNLTSAIGLKAGDTLLAEIVERYPNGNYRFRGSKRVPYRNTTKLVAITGVVRGTDLADDDKIPSGKVYEYRLEAVR